MDKELKTIEKFLTSYPAINAEKVFAQLSTERQKLVSPVVDPDDVYVKNWKSIEYKGKSFLESTPELYTSEGERVRSKSEVIIADVLEREGIPYCYEKPTYLKNIGKIYPDFTVQNTKKTERDLLGTFGNDG